VIDEAVADTMHEELETHDQPVETGNRRALVLAAYARIAADGFEGLRTRDVAADVGVNIGTLHYYFPSKEALIRAVVRHTLSRFAATLSSSGSPAEQLRAHLEGIRHLLKTDQQQWAVMSEISLRTARDDAIAELMRDSENMWFEFLSGLVARGIAAGDLAPDLHPEGVASALIAAIGGVCMPTQRMMQPERIDLTFDQLARWLGLSLVSTELTNNGAAECQ
jgi:AcrR family transcriptional regulator